MSESLLLPVIYERLAPHLQRVCLEAGSVLFDIGATIDYTWFITSGIVSLLRICESISPKVVATRPGPISVIATLPGRALAASITLWQKLLFSISPCSHRLNDDQVSHPHYTGHRPRSAFGLLAFGPRTHIARKNRRMIARRHFDLPRVNLSAVAGRFFKPFLNVGGRSCGSHFDQIGHRLHTSDTLHRFFSGYFLKIAFHCPFECEQPVLYSHHDFAAQEMNVAFQKVNSVLSYISVRAFTHHSHQKFIGEAFDAEKSLHRLFSRGLLRVVVHEPGERHHTILHSHADPRSIDFRLKVELSDHGVAQHLVGQVYSLSFHCLTFLSSYS